MDCFSNSTTQEGLEKLSHWEEIIEKYDLALDKKKWRWRNKPRLKGEHVSDGRERAELNFIGFSMSASSYDEILSYGDKKEKEENPSTQEIFEVARWRGSGHRFGVGRVSKCL